MTENIGETASTFSGAFKKNTYINRTASNGIPYLGVGELIFDASLVWKEHSGQEFAPVHVWQPAILYLGRAAQV